MLTIDQPLSATAVEIQWLWPDSFSNNKYVIMIGEGGLHVEMTGRVVEWFWMAKCNHNCWNSVAESFVKASYLARQDMPTRLQLQRCILCSGMPSFLIWSLNLIMLSAPNSGKHRWRLNNRSLNTGLDFQLYVLRLVR